MKITNKNEIIVKTLNEQDIIKIMRFQDLIFDNIEDKDLFRKNTKDMFLCCTRLPNVTIGMFHKNCDNLIAMGILYYGYNTNEDLSTSLKTFNIDSKKSINFKLVAVLPMFRGNGFQSFIMTLLERIAYQYGYTSICSTVSPNNYYSEKNIKNGNYIFDTEVYKYGGKKRNLYYKNLEYVNIKNKKILSNLSKLEGTDSVSEMRQICDINKCFVGELNLATTGDLLEYIDEETQLYYYGIYIKKFEPMVCIFNPRKNCIEVIDFSDRINIMVLNRVLLNIY